MEGIARLAISSACFMLILSLSTPAFALPAATAVNMELVARGKAFFTGARPLAKGGAPCAACHSFRSLGIAGGNLAVDLTNLYEGAGEDNLNAILRNLDFTVMKMIYANRPLTDEEITAIISFTRYAAAGKKEETLLLFPLAGVGIFICCLAILTLYKRRVG